MLRDAEHSPEECSDAATMGRSVWYSFNWCSSIKACSSTADGRAGNGVARGICGMLYSCVMLNTCTLCATAQSWVVW